MTMRIPLRCRCGNVRGFLADVSPRQRKRAVCYCDDCQIYVQHLGRGDILDERGGTGAVMTTPAQLTLSAGAAHVRAVRLSPKGVYRWYAGCCNTPIGNTLGPKLPVLILPLTSLDFAALGKTADEALGPPTVRMHGRFARGGVPVGAHPKAPAAMIPRFVGHLLRGYLKGLTRPSPFFDTQGQPRVEPQVIDKAERESLRAEVLAAARS